MAEINVAVSERSWRDLRLTAQVTGETESALLEKAIREFCRRKFFEAANASYAALRADPQAWAEELAERQRWDATLMDGLDPSERWTDDGRPLPPGEEQAP